mgnify:FL=1
MSREMKKVPIDFANSIPTEWECSRLKYHCKITNGSDPKTEGDIPVYGSGSEIVKYCGEFKKGPAILIGRKGTLDKPKLVEGKYWNVDTAMDLHPYTHMNSKYLYYVTSCFTIDKYSTCTAKPSMTQGDYYNILIPVPSNSEQKSIAAFLDSKCEAIDQAIQKQKDIVNKLIEYKQSVITQAVTKGLNPNVQMKDVSIDFTNSIPQKWECSRLKYHCRITNGADPKTEGNIPVYGSGSEIVKYCGEFKNGPAILIGRKGTLDKPKLVEGKYWNVDTAMDLHPHSHMNPKYLYYVISCFTIDKYSTCTAKPSMTQGDYYNILIPVPSALEQDEIVEYVDSKCDSIDESIERSNKIIQKLEEYKKSLIYNAVTGKIDCRGEVR